MGQSTPLTLNGNGVSAQRTGSTGTSRAAIIVNDDTSFSARAASIGSFGASNFAVTVTVEAMSDSPFPDGNASSLGNGTNFGNTSVVLGQNLDRASGCLF